MARLIPPGKSSLVWSGLLNKKLLWEYKLGRVSLDRCLGCAEHGGNSLVMCVWRDISVLLGRTRVLSVVGAGLRRMVSGGACLCGLFLFFLLLLDCCPVRVEASVGVSSARLQLATQDVPSLAFNEQHNGKATCGNVVTRKGSRKASVLF